MSIESHKVRSEEYSSSEMAMKPCQPFDIIDVLISVVWPLLFIVGYVIADSYLLHWFIVPVYLCGVLISIDAASWIRGRMDTFDPRGLVGLFGCNFFVLAPILVAYYRAGKVGNIYLDDMRPWLGYMALLNFFGIMLYKYFEGKVSKRPIPVIKHCLENPARSAVILPLSVLVIISCHAYFTIKGGGLSAYIAHRTYGGVGALAGTIGLGPINVIGRALPITFLIAITVWFRKSGRKVSFISMVITLLAFLIAQFLVAGLTGSRSSIMWALFWAGGIIHFFWRPIPVKLVLISIIPLMLFLYLYGFYKEMGSGSLGVFTGQVSVKSLEYETKRTFARVLIGDIGRSDVQAAILSAMVDSDKDYDLRYGQTYLTSAVSMIPRRIWPSKPGDSGKVIAGTEILYGKGVYSRRHTRGIGKRSTHIYGLAGEAMLNFGVLGVLPAFAIWGVIVGYIRRKILNFSESDMRLLIYPYWVLMSFFMLIQDLDNFVQVSVYNLLVPAFIVWLISFKAKSSVYDDGQI